MNYEIIEMQQFSGKRAGIYSVMIADDNLTLFEHFVKAHVRDYALEVRSITQYLSYIGNRYGMQSRFFKVDRGMPQDGVCVLFDHPEKKLRLYCYRVGTAALIIGGGMPRPGRRGGEGVPEKMLASISQDIRRKIRAGDIYWSAQEARLCGDLVFRTEEK
ncbi:hypothetical protein SAMN04488128_10698 [Chitinophaga eiseniae]|uniref:Uncharacterized protein n=1 Tax=Chitinophaga eiseniae TaxID=634771 RepID=A0A1T4TRI9_9BACT|nr:hypothetical protein [Chitinophaga eiseniae]SKA43075.1 hypothetical protein SAMN04488128_10698 [Chitinophaga eiseniae]